MLLPALELLVGALLFWGALIEVLIPLWRGTILLPTFRSKRHQLERTLAAEREQEEVHELERQVRTVRLSSEPLDPPSPPTGGSPTQ